MYPRARTRGPCPAPQPWPRRLAAVPRPGALWTSKTKLRPDSRREERASRGQDFPWPHTREGGRGQAERLRAYGAYVRSRVETSDGLDVAHRAPCVAPTVLGKCRSRERGRNPGTRGSQTSGRGLQRCPGPATPPSRPPGSAGASPGTAESQLELGADGSVGEGGASVRRAQVPLRTFTSVVPPPTQ